MPRLQRTATILGIALICSIVAGCGIFPGDEPDGERPGEGFQLCDDSMLLPDDTYTVYGAAYAGDDILEIDVGYSGGCESHEWTLCWDGNFMESDPVQVTLDLRHEANNDMCEAYIEETLEFELDELRQAYSDGYGGDSGTIVIGLKDDGESVTYEW